MESNGIKHDVFRCGDWKMSEPVDYGSTLSQFYYEEVMPV